MKYLSDKLHVCDNTFENYRLFDGSDGSGVS